MTHTPISRRQHLRPVPTLTLTPAQAAAVAPMVRERIAILRELQAVQVESLPPGSDAWADTAETIDHLHGALMTLEGFRR
jgi:hypothetical protein